MPKKQEKRKKAWREGCRAQVRKGLINQADGSWSAPSPVGRAMADMMRAGYRA